MKCYTIAIFFEMTVEAVFRDVQFAVDEPFNFRFGEIPVEDLVPLFLPRKIAGDFCPKLFRRRNTSVIRLSILLKGQDSHNSQLKMPLKVSRIAVKANP